MQNRKLWSVLPAVLALALACVACGGDDGATPGGNGGNGGNGGDTPDPEPPVVQTVYEASPAGRDACRDTYLILEFKTSPTLGTTGAIRIFRSDGTQVDYIDMADVAAAGERVQMTNTSLFTTVMDAIGSSVLGRYRIVNYDPVRAEGTRITIKPHYGVLTYDASYYVTVDASAIEAAGFEGIAAGEWTFATKSAPASRSAVTVGASGCDFRTVQAALDYACECGRDQAVEITVRDGIYEEQLYMRTNNRVTLRGESRGGTVIRYDNCDLYASGVGGGVAGRPTLGEAIGTSGGRAVMLVENCDLLRIENLTLENTHGPGSQAEVLYNNDNNGTGRVVFIGCNLLGAQDTLNLKGYAWFYDCLIAGDVDFIWGGADTALFENCEIRAVNGGYIVQARCAAGKRGFVFLNCDLTQGTGGNGKPMYLARSSGAAAYCDQVAFVGCRMGSHIPAAGWYATPAPNPAAASATDGWKEYGSRDAQGAALDLSGRLSAACRLTQAEYEAGYKNRETVFAACSKGTEWLVE